MYTHTPTSKFLVLSPIESGPEAQKFSKRPNTNKFLVLSPTESGPHSSFDDAEDSSSEAPTPTPSTLSTAATQSGFLFLGHPTSSLRARSESCSSVASDSSAASVVSASEDVPQLTASPSPASLAGGFLYLGHPAPVRME